MSHLVGALLAALLEKVEIWKGGICETFHYQAGTSNWHQLDPAVGTSPENQHSPLCSVGASLGHRCVEAVSKGKKTRNSKHDFSMKECGRKKMFRECQAALSFRGPLDFKVLSGTIIWNVQRIQSYQNHLGFFLFYLNLTMGFYKEHTWVLH